MSSPRLPRTTAGTLSASKDDGAAIGPGHTMSAFATVHSYVAYSTASYRRLEEPCFDCCGCRDAWSSPPGSSTRRHLAGCLLAYSYALVMAAAMATTVHWMSDMVAGLCIGMAIAIAAAAMPFGAPHCPCSLVAVRGKSTPGTLLGFNRSLLYVIDTRLCVIQRPNLLSTGQNERRKITPAFIRDFSSTRAHER